jgi:hypothetical protein
MSRRHAEPVPLIERRNFLAAHRALQVLWTRHAKEPGYDKSMWMELDNAIVVLAMDGPGARVSEDRKA